MFSQLPAVWVDLDSLGKNFEILRARSPGGVVFPVLKADAYGHGARIVAEFLEKSTPRDQCPLFCVARWGEALEVLRAQKTRDVLILSDRFSSENYKSVDPRLSERMVWVLNDFSDFENFFNLQIPQRLHLNFNTGMNRLGLEKESVGQETFWQSLTRLYQSQHQIEGVMTHLSDGEENPKVFSNHQVHKFEEILSVLKNQWPQRIGKQFPKWIHVENSGGNYWKVGSNLSNAVRPGLHLYGVVAKLNPEFEELHLSPVLEVRAPLRKILHLKLGEKLGYNRTFECSRESYIGVVGLGYADGVSRRFSQSGSTRFGFWINGSFAPLVGTVSMDLCHIDLTDHPQIQKIKDQPQNAYAQWLGPRQSAWDLAKGLGTIPYEILTSLGHRLPRIPAKKDKIL